MAVQEDIMETNQSSQKTFRDKRFKILHFNDVYNIEARAQEPVGGASRFTQKVCDLCSSDKEIVVLFSGDAFNPSQMSTVFKGIQMVPVLNAMNITAAVFGNHDFDFGIDELMGLKNACYFPWMMSNVIDKDTGKLLGDGVEYVVHEHNGVKIGLIGLVELAWMETLSTLELGSIQFEDYVECANRVGGMLKTELRVDIVVALTHMRWHNDLRLAELCPFVDVVLGGHDHEFDIKDVNGKLVLKSGTDFRELSVTTLTFDDNNKITYEVERIEITADIPENPQIKSHVEEYKEKMGAQMERVIGQFGVPLETRFAEIRTKESNMGNFITDVMRVALRADMAILNSGTLRSDCVFPVGVFKMKDLAAILPIQDELLLIQCTGAEIIEALENGVSKYPALEGRFPQVSGISFKFDPRKEPGNRILADSIIIRCEPIKLDYKYKVAVKDYLARGKDGYNVFANCPRIGDDDDGPILDTLILNHFTEVERQRKQRKENIPLLKRKKKSIHRQQSVLRSKNHQIVEAQIQTLKPMVTGRIICVDT